MTGRELVPLELSITVMLSFCFEDPKVQMLDLSFLNGNLS